MISFATAPSPKITNPKPYRPSNGFEGELFMEAWCARCARDAAFREDHHRADGCLIVADAMALSIGDDGYPEAWVIGDELQPCCTAFSSVAADEPPRCDRTADLFERLL